MWLAEERNSQLFSTEHVVGRTGKDPGGELGQGADAQAMSKPPGRH